MNSKPNRVCLYCGRASCDGDCFVIQSAGTGKVLASGKQLMQRRR